MPAHPTGAAGCSWSGDAGTEPGARFWPTPVARDWKGGSPEQRGRRRACQLNDAVGGRLDPSFVEWLMGFPEGWTAPPG